MNQTFDLLFAGVGGQGSLLIAELTSIAASMEDYDVKQTEVHGVSQRGGSVETHVRFGKKIHSPVVTPGEADAVIALEKLEALRFAHFVDQEKGIILVNDYEIIPGSVAGAEEKYPYQAIDHLQKKGLSVVVFPASQMAHKIGDSRIANVVMLGALSNLLPIPLVRWEETLHHRLPPRFLEGNLKAFAVGRDLLEDGNTNS